MAKARSAGKAETGSKTPGPKRWAALTWDDLDAWAGARSVERGRSYQRGGQVQDLTVAEDGRLLATVIGTRRYVTAVWRTKGRGEKLESKCSCPVGYNGCKHAVAVVAAYLNALANDQSVPVAAADDPRWDKASGAGEDYEDEFDEDDFEDDEEGEDDEAPAPPRRSRPKRQSRSSWDDKIRQLINAKSREELVELVWSLTERFPELREEFRERIALSEGDVDRLVAEARRELQDVASEPGWRNRWNDEGHTPDYSRFKHRLERLAEQGHYDAVAELGRDFIQRGLRQVAESHDEGETATAVADCLPVVFQAVSRSSLPGPQKILFAIDAHLADDYDLVNDANDAILDAAWPAGDWSAVADLLAAGLEREPAGSPGDFSRNYRRDRVTNWLVQALGNAGREDEVLAVHEREARATGSYERLVRHLVEARRYEDAERWAREGIEKTHQKLPGIASGLAKSLCDVARGRRAWDVVAAHAAWPFFANPSPAAFNELLKAARQAKCEEPVRAAALRFLETGKSPFRLVASRGGESRIEIAADWPLPLPDYLVPLLRLERIDRQPGPHFQVLLEMALAAKRPDDVLHWYDKLSAADNRSAPIWLRNVSLRYADQVAAAVADSHPERALAIYHAALRAQLPQANPNAYESAAHYLRRLRPILKALGREAEWTQLLADIRRQYSNRPKFMQILARLDGGTILQAERARRKR